MNRWRSAWTPLRTLLRRRRAEQDMDEELRLHLELEAERLERAGIAPAAARAAAQRTFGSIASVKDDCRESLGVRLVDVLAQDVRIGTRMLRRSPGFTLAVLVAMALGIGANTAIFSVVYGAVLKPLPYEGGDRVVVLHAQLAKQGVDDASFSALELQDYRGQARTIERIVEYHWMAFIFYGRTEPERLRTGVVSADYFQALGIRPLHGRLFVPSDDTPSAPGVIVLSHAYWQRAFGGDRTVVGKTFRFNDRPHTVIGILPPIPLYPEENAIFMPVSHCPFHSNPEVVSDRTMRMKQAFARLKPGVSLEQAQAELDAIRLRLQAAYPEAYRAAEGYRVVATPLQTELMQNFRSTLAMLVATAALVLLIVCASVANLLLARLLRRERELAVRMAIGAGRLRLTCQLLTETLVLTCGGALLGLAVAAGSLTLLRTLTARFTPRAQEITLDGTTLIFTLGLAVLTGLAFGILPALHGPRAVLPSLTETGGGATGSTARVRLRNALVVAQVAISLALVAGAGLLTRSFVNLSRVDPGFRADQVATWSVPLNFTKYNTAELRRQFYRRFLQELEADPRLVSVGVTGTAPLNGFETGTTSLRFRHRATPPDQPQPRAGYQVASPSYFQVVGVPLLGGRTFTDSDDQDAPPVVIVNQALASRYWGRENPIGQAIGSEDGERWFTVVGVVGNARQRLDADAAEEVYRPLLQAPMASPTFAARSRASQPELAASVRAIVNRIDPEQPVDTFRTLEESRSQALAPPRLSALLIGLFAGLALVVTAVGLAGVMGYAVSQRVREFGVRLALGAERGDLLVLVLGQGLWLVGVGIALGLGGALLLTRQLSGLLYGVAPTDIATFVVATLVLVGVGAGACLLPARRASRVDPLTALRGQ
jgi:putative ABC transport system permease protein